MKVSEFKDLLKTELITSTYELLTESINPQDHYTFEHTRKNLWEFKDRKQITHFIIINQSLYKGDTSAEIKFGWIDDTGSRRYDKPPTYDEKIFNTHTYIFLYEILRYYLEYFTKFYLEAVDSLRYRLYRQTLSKLLDRDLYDVEEVETKHTLIILPKQEVVYESK